MIIGWIGVFFARLIQAAVSRQREFLADASAVQYTRNPDGIGQALSKLQIYGSQVSHPKAQEASHMFFGMFNKSFLFSTHPPIEERLGRLKFVPVPPKSTLIKNDSSQTGEKKVPLQKIGEINPKDIMTAMALIQSLDPEISAGVRETKYTKEIIFAILAHRQDDQNWLNKLDPKLVHVAKKMTDQQILLLIDLAMPVLSHLPAAEASIFYLQMEDLVFADKKLSPLELSFLSLVRQGLNLESDQNLEKNQSLMGLKTEALHTLKLLVLSDHNQSTKALAAFEAGVQEMFAQQIEKNLKNEVLKVWESSEQHPRFLLQCLRKLSRLKPEDQALVFTSLWVAAHHDLQVTANEALLLKAFSEVLQVPLPAGALNLTEIKSN